MIDSQPVARSAPPFDARELGLAEYDRQGIFRNGRIAELRLLASMGRRDPSLGRLYEGHFNALLLTSLYGTLEQRRVALADAASGNLFGVWNTQPAQGVRIEADGARFRLSGAKTWASGADSVTRALITARNPAGSLVMCLVPLDRSPVVVDASEWHPMGMDASNSFRVSFDGVVLDTADIIGANDDYERAPWFLGGALRFAAVHAGIIERLADETLAYVKERGRMSDPHQRTRAGLLRIAARGAWNWVEAGASAWADFDRLGTSEASDRVVDMADMARCAIERAGLDAIELAVRCSGAHGLLNSVPIGRLVRDLHMYLRQPAPDAALERVGGFGLERIGT